MVTEKTEKTNKAKSAGTVLGGRYELKGVVGRGGFSIVYEATDLKSGEKVAVKECTVLSEKERFLREAKMLADYAGESAIVRVIGYFEDEETAYIVMEFLEGENLRECIEHSGRWTMEEAVQRMAPVQGWIQQTGRQRL